jgi:HAD superfamily hydrolase (TIGR01509 family)
VLGAGPALQPELVIFDCDGVLVDSERLAVRIHRTILAGFGLELSEEEVVKRLVGREPTALQDMVEAHAHTALSDESLAEFREIYLSAYRAELATVDGVLEALDRIAVPTCVASGSHPDSLRLKLELTGLSARFEGRVFSASEVERPKPAPDLFLHAARTLGVEPRACVVVEDSRPGVRAGRSAGMRVLAYGGGLVSARDLEGPGTTVFHDMRMLPDLIEGCGAEARGARR